VPATGPAVILKRLVEAPVNEVFRAWTDPALIRRWLAPDPYEVCEVEADVRPGGRYSIVVREPNGRLHKTTGTYREVVPDRRLVKTWFYEGPFGPDETPSIVTVELREVSPGRTELTLTHAQLRDEDAAKRVGSGWALCFDKLEAITGEAK
jgi:uncharacterized protein YndB with AHSA1/START domain